MCCLSCGVLIPASWPHFEPEGVRRHMTSGISNTNCIQCSNIATDCSEYELWPPVLIGFKNAKKQSWAFHLPRNDSTATLMHLPSFSSVSYGAPCVATSDCALEHSKCVSGSCKCDVNHKHDPSTGACVSQCDEYGEEFTMYEKSIIYGHADAEKKVNI